MKWMGLLLIFLIVLATRLFFAFSTPYLTLDDAYLQYRLVQNILETGMPGLDDALSWAGSFVNLSPVFSYILSFFAMFMPITLALKIVPNVFASLLVVPVFLIVYHAARSYWVALLASFVSSFVPVFFANTVNHANIVALTLPLFFWLVYCWMRSDRLFWVYLFAGGVVFFAFLSPSSLILVLGLILFVVLAKIERLEVSMSDMELLLFCSGFVLWAQFLLYKHAILMHGIHVFWLNVPDALLSSLFSKLSLFGVLWQVGFFPLVAGLYVLYRNVMKAKDRFVYLFFSFVVIITVLLWLRLVEFLFGLMLLGVFLTILFSLGIPIFQNFIYSTKFAKLGRVFTFFVVLSVVFTSFFPSVVAANAEMADTISVDEVSALMWLKKYAPEDAVVVSPVSMGHYVSAIAGRRNVIDSWFLLHDDAEERFHDVDRIYHSVLETEVVSLLDKYNASFVLFPSVNDGAFTQSACFELKFNDSVRIFEKDPECHLRVVS